ncbi:MAG: alanine racemase [Proteobacteria bacterium]|nr:alanine racemase [Pseudomonadota bacterium]MBI3498620.1 alanine racemase [Pseudomonadota bacterium]
MTLDNQQTVQDQHARPNRFEIDLGAIAGFSRNIRKLVGPDTTIFATLKCNAYGFGLLPVARTVLSAGLDALAMVDRANAIELRQAGVVQPILVYPGSIATAEAVAAVEAHDLIPTLVDLESAAIYSRFATRPLKVAVKVDIGQERLGFPAEAAAEAIAAIGRMQRLQVHIVNAHPNVPTPPSMDYLEWQLGRFEAIMRQLDKRGITVPIRMIASSKILAMAPRLHLSGVDPGQMLFGPFKQAGDVPWPTQRQAFRSLSSRLIHVRAIERSQYLKEAPFPIKSGMRIGVIPIGSADGAAELHAGEALVRGKRVPVIGASLEHTRLDLSAVSNAALGDEVVLIGEQNGEAITPEVAVAFQQHARVADLAMAVRPSIPRRYIGPD